MKENKRDHNVFFNLHTVSGIVISVGLFIIFFAGAFALFRDEINLWHHNEINQTEFTPKIDYDRILAITKNEGYELEGRERITIIQDKSYTNIIVRANTLIYKKDTLQILTKKDSFAKSAINLKIDSKTYKITSRKRTPKRYLGTFIYQLHYFKQIPFVGRYIAGFIALFFAFSIFTGIIIHWKKIVSNFFTFRIKNSIKNLWTDAHAALGVLGIPFQLMYAITGTYLGVVSLLYVPSLFIVFDGSIDKAEQLISPPYVITAEAQATNKQVKINPLIDNVLTDVNHDEINGVFMKIKNFGKNDANISIDLIHNSVNKFAASTTSLFRMSDGKKIYQKLIFDDYFKAYRRTLTTKLHYAQFGGYLTKITYFILSVITCFVIISGVLVWLEARENKKYAAKANFNRNVGAIYMGICMGLYPAIALFFCLVKILPSITKKEFSISSSIFFLFWLAFIIYSFFIKSPYKINKKALLFAGILGVLIPLLNGFQSGIWFFNAFQKGYVNSFFVDIIWLIVGIITLLTAFYAKPLKRKKEKR
tara:strand:- start:4742 stop:6346 length:1605 start_codon:yes stop_codon:yes gene_type:complete